MAYGSNYNWSVISSLYILYGPALWFECRWWFTLCPWWLLIMFAPIVKVSDSASCRIDLHPRMVGSTSMFFSCVHWVICVLCIPGRFYTSMFFFFFAQWVICVLHIPFAWIFHVAVDLLVRIVVEKRRPSHTESLVTKLPNVCLGKPAYKTKLLFKKFSLDFFLARKVWIRDDTSYQSK